MTTSAGNRSEGFYNTDGSLQIAKVKSLVRTYVKKAQGTIESMDFVSTNTQGASSTPGTFSAKIKVDLSVDAPTLIHAMQDSSSPVAWYANGFDLKVTGAGSVAPKVDQSMSGNEISIKVTNKEFDGQTLVVEITPKAASEQFLT